MSHTLAEKIATISNIDDKKKTLIILDQERELWLKQDTIRQASPWQINELREWLLLKNNDERTAHIQIIKKRQKKIIQRIHELQRKLQLQTISFEEAAENAGEDDVESLLEWI